MPAFDLLHCVSWTVLFIYLCYKGMLPCCTRLL